MSEELLEDLKDIVCVQSSSKNCTSENGLKFGEVGQKYDELKRRSFL